MKTSLLQKIAFIIIAISLFMGPLFDKPGVFTYIAIAGSVFYLCLGWLLPMIKDEKQYFSHEIAGFCYSTVMIASVLEQYSMPGARYFTYYGEILALALMIYMIVKRKEVNRYMLIQSVILLCLSAVPVLAK
jgi:hypothetical protein